MGKGTSDPRRLLEADVLIVGGGLAGCTAAIKAREQGVSVILVDKGYVGKSGQTPFAGSYCVFNPEWGDDLDAWMQQIDSVGEYVNNRTWTELCLKESLRALLRTAVLGREVRPGRRCPAGRGAASGRHAHRPLQSGDDGSAGALHASAPGGAQAGSDHRRSDHGG